MVSIVEHLDEKHGHLHVLVSAGGRSVKPLHPGYAASVQLRQAGARRPPSRTHTRPRRVRGRMSTRRRWRRLVGWLGRPGRQRLSRAQWLDQQRQVEAAAIRGRRLDEKDKTISQAAATARELKSR